MTETNSPTKRIEIPEKTFFKIGEVARLLDVEPYVLRYWESEFESLDPDKTRSGQRVYKRADIELLMDIRGLLYEEMFTIAGARRQLERRAAGEVSCFDNISSSGPAAALSSSAGEQGILQWKAERAELHEKLRHSEEEIADQQIYLEELERARDKLAEECATLASQLEEHRLEASNKPEVEDQEREKLIAILQQEIAGLQQELDTLHDEQRAALDAQDRERHQGDERRRGLIKALRREVIGLTDLAHA